MEQEIRKSVHNILKEVTDRKKSIWKKIGEIFLEMLIIIFAVSFAVMMERRREHSHEQKEAKEFLIGLRIDLLNDIKEMREDSLGYQEQTKWFKYFATEKQPDKDTVKKYQWVLWNTTHLLVNNGRYEGFKESGKMNTIENMQLRNDILDIYQENLVALTNRTTGYNNVKRDFLKLVYKVRRNAGEATDNLAEVLREPEIHNYCLQLRYTGEVVLHYDSCIRRSQRIIELIDKEYPEK